MRLQFKYFLSLWVLILAVVFSFIGYWPSKTYFISCDVGQGDAILITSGFTQALIDAGPDEKVLECLADNMPFWDRTIELVVNTHPEADHYTGLKYVLQRYEISQFISSNILNPSEFFLEFRKLVIDKGVNVYSPKRGDELKIGNLEFKVLWPQSQPKDLLVWQKSDLPANVLGAKSQSFNDSSIVLLFEHKNFKAFLSGDISSRVEEELSSSQALPRVNLLKISHHGSKYSTSDKLLEVLKPSTAIISVGKNSWGHPTEEVIERLKTKGIKILRTDQDGEIKVSI